MLIDVIAFGSVEPLIEIEGTAKVWFSDDFSCIDSKSAILNAEILTIKTLEELLRFKMGAFIEAPNKPKEAALLKEIEIIKNTITILREFELPL